MTTQVFETEQAKIVSEGIIESQTELDIKTKVKLALISVILGLTLNWISLFLRITLGFLSIGISVFFVLLIAKVLLGNQATRQNLAIVSIAYGATTAAEASIGLLFLIWLSENAQFFGSSGVFPSWLLPSADILASKTLFSTEWLVPLAVHFFIMLIPGFAGIILGLYLKRRYLDDDHKYPFPSVAQRSQMVDVLVTNQSDKVRLFRRFLIIGFGFAFVTLFFPVIDFSQPQNGWILGLSLGVIGVALFAIGFIVNNWKITVTASISSLVVYVVLSPFIVKESYLEAVSNGLAGQTYFDFYTFALQAIFMSFIVGFLLSATIISPLVWKFGKKIFHNIFGIGNNKEADSVEENNQMNETDANEIDQNEETASKSLLTRLHSIQFSRKDVYFLLIFSTIYFLSVLFVYFTRILGDNLVIIGIVMFWILVVGSIVIGIITSDSIAKTSAAMSPPFIFDVIPLFLAGARGFVPYIAIPQAEVGETTSIVVNSKFSKQQGLSTKAMVVAYLMGYLPAILTTPFFALLLWRSFGIGTPLLPAPAFPIQAMLIAPFAAGSIDAVLNFIEVLLGIVAAIIAGPGLGIGLAFGMFFPPHMALTIGMGGLTRILANKRFNKDWVQDKGTTAATAISVGASLTIPLLILLNLFFL
ncbi:MAG: OPT/YSL family transporter [Candidatus Hodarchaeales archaeon]|jgi:hypothetical protein